MGMDLYAGTLTRYYAHNWKTEAQQWAEENGFGYQKITSGTDSQNELSVREIRQIIENWRDSLLSAIREHNNRVGSWPEDNERPYLTNKPDWPAFEALLLYAACKSLGEQVPKKFGKKAQFEDFEISKRAYNTPKLQWSLFKGVVCWLPLEAGFVINANMPTGNEAVISTTWCLLRELEKINSYDWNADEATINRWYDEDGYETKDSKLTKLTDNVSMIEPESGLYDTESLARFAFARFYRAAQFAQENQVPVLMDF